MGTENSLTREPPKRKINYKWKNVFIGEHPDTGKRYFEKRKVAVPDPTNLPEEPLQIDYEAQKSEIDEVTIPTSTLPQEKTPEGIPIRPLFDPEVEKHAIAHYDAYINQGGKPEDD